MFVTQLETLWDLRLFYSKIEEGEVDSFWSYPSVFYCLHAIIIRAGKSQFDHHRDGALLLDRGRFRGIEMALSEMTLVYFFPEATKHRLLS